ncbi:hypothetical protein L0222_26965 [bacterium]|nr:hypothetical protein [bacterium]
MWRSVRIRLTIFFLLFTLADIAIPGFCQTDDHRTNVTKQSREAVTLAAFSQGLSFIENERTGTQLPVPMEDDCFCCCSHIALFHVQMDVLDETAKPSVLPSPRFFSRFSYASIYHPPRYA